MFGIRKLRWSLFHCLTAQ